MYLGDSYPAIEDCVFFLSWSQIKHLFLFQGTVIDCLSFALPLLAIQTCSMERTENKQRDKIRVIRWMTQDIFRHFSTSGYRTTASLAQNEWILISFSNTHYCQSSFFLASISFGTQAPRVPGGTNFRSWLKCEAPLVRIIRFS